MTMMTSLAKNAKNNRMNIFALEMIGITKKFTQGGHDIVALNNVSLAIKKGEIAALVGPSGSGKTTLLQIAGLLDSPNSGQIFVNSSDASKANDALRTKIRRNNLGFIYQFHHLLPEFSALENVSLPLLIQGMDKDYALAEAKKILTEVDLLNRIDHKPAELSGGQQQRVAIARAIITKPSLILADEPTGNLDSVNSERVFDLLKNLVKSFGVACLLVTHNIELAKKLDRTITIKDGMIDS